MVLINIFLLAACTGTKKNTRGPEVIDDVYGAKDFADAFVSAIKHKQSVPIL